MTTAAPFLSNENEPSSPSVSYIQSQKGKPMLVLNNYIFKLNKITTSLGARTKQAKTIAIQRCIDNLDKRYYDGLIDVMEYLNGLSFTVAKRKK